MKIKQDWQLKIIDFRLGIVEEAPGPRFQASGYRRIKEISIHHSKFTSLKPGSWYLEPVAWNLISTADQESW